MANLIKKLILSAVGLASLLLLSGCYLAPAKNFNHEAYTAQWGQPYDAVPIAMFDIVYNQDQ